jgi:hypothetical protein
MFLLRFRSEIIRRNVPKDLSRVETFPGAARLTRFAIMRRAETNIVGSFRHDPKRLPSSWAHALARPLQLLHPIPPSLQGSNQAMVANKVA